MLTTEQHKATQCRCFCNWNNALCSVALTLSLFSSTALGFTKRFRKPKCWLNFSENLGLHVWYTVKRWVLFFHHLFWRSWHSHQEDGHLQFLESGYLKSNIPDAWQVDTWRIKEYVVCRTYCKWYKPLYFWNYFTNLS